MDVSATIICVNYIVYFISSIIMYFITFFFMWRKVEFLQYYICFHLMTWYISFIFNSLYMLLFILFNIRLTPNTVIAIIFSLFIYYLFLIHRYCFNSCWGVIVVNKLGYLAEFFYSNGCKNWFWCKNWLIHFYTRCIIVINKLLYYIILFIVGIIIGLYILFTGIKLFFLLILFCIKSFFLLILDKICSRSRVFMNILIKHYFCLTGPFKGNRDIPYSSWSIFCYCLLFFLSFFLILILNGLYYLILLPLLKHICIKSFIRKLKIYCWFLNRYKSICLVINIYYQMHSWFINWSIYYIKSLYSLY